ncbi:MAG: IPExxxVDY family protein [Marinilabiliales bacterium]|nr:MAG: IPExxxVDY family protein [Marinilabiliales bacterium]
MKTRKLKYKPDYDFKLLGLSSVEEDYKLSWELSRTLNTGFVKSMELRIIDPKFSDFLLFSVFENEDKSGFPDIRLVSNKGKEGYLIEELKNIDFFIIIHDDEDTNFYTEFVSKLKKSEVITAVFQLEPNKLKSKEKLLF